MTGRARQFSEFVVTDLSFGGGSKIAARSRMKARLTLLSKQAISRGYVVDKDVFRLGLLKKDYQSSVKRRRHLKELSPGHANAYHNIPLT